MDSAMRRQFEAEYRERVEREATWEKAVWARTVAAVEALADVIADDDGYALHWGDGQGGSIVQQLSDALARRDLLAPSLRIPTPGPTALEILERDAYRCVECGDWHRLQIDHDVPRSRGGSNDPSNLQTLCGRCNAEKGAKTTAEWHAWKEARK